MPAKDSVQGLSQPFEPAYTAGTDSPSISPPAKRASSRLVWEPPQKRRHHASVFVASLKS